MKIIPMIQHLLTQDLVIQYILHMTLNNTTKCKTIFFQGSEEPEQRTLSRNDSDVEILSNPSDSSVEVLEVISTYVW